MSKSRILVVDDEMPSREICADFLIEKGYEVETAINGREGLAKLSIKPFQILLTDIQMPEMDGVALLRESKRLYPNLEVILMTAFGGLPSAVEAIRFGAYDYLTKPLSLEGLQNTVRKCEEKIDLHRKLKESQQKLVEQEKLAALGAVSSWLSHRMRNSLSVIHMCVYYLEKRTLPTAPGDLKEVIKAIIDKVRVLEGTTNDLINYSRGYELQMDSQDLNAIVEEVLRLLQVQAQFQKVKVVKRLDPELPSITCDPHILHEAIENVVMNALQAIGEIKNQTITVKTEVLQERFFNNEVSSVNNRTTKLFGDQEEEKLFVTLSIHNTGSLISPEDMQNIFMPFFTTKETGSGLGLAIVKKIVEQHEGKITAHSEEKKGQKSTIIRMTFPVKELNG